MEESPVGHKSVDNTGTSRIFNEFGARFGPRPLKNGTDIDKK
jgi:hypothetical protein